MRHYAIRKVPSFCSRMPRDVPWYLSNAEGQIEPRTAIYMQLLTEVKVVDCSGVA